MPQVQSFSTKPVINTNVIYYTLAILMPGSKTVQHTYVFPLSPSALRKEYATLSTPYLTQGANGTAGVNGQRGVTRSVDKYGSAPPTYTLEGTTGWQYHSIDGFGLTGMQSIAALQAFFASYDVLNQGQMNQNIPDLYTMEFYDYFADEYWQIEPVGRQGVTQDAARPLLFRYQFRWEAIQSVADPPAPPADPIITDFTQSPNQAQAGLSSSVGDTLDNYA